MTVDQHAPRYNQTFLSFAELYARISTRFDPIDVSRVSDAYEMARSVHEYQRRNDGTPYFWHATRVARIILDELKLYDADLLIAGLLHDVLEDSDSITRNVIEYNFGAYVGMIVQTLTKDLSKARNDPDGVDIEYAQRLQAAPDECLIIKISSRLDNFRCLSFHLKRNPLVYIRNTSERYIPLCDSRRHPSLLYLVNEIRQEANKLLG